MAQSAAQDAQQNAANSNITVTPAQVATQIAKDGGTPLQQYVGAALHSGVESGASAAVNELAGGVGPAAGLFQFEPETWIGNGGGQYADTAGDATWQDQVAVFVNATKGNNFGDWGPDLGGGYGYSGAPMPGSRVYNVMRGLPGGAAILAGGNQNYPNTPDAGGVTQSNPVPGPVGDVLGLATGGTIAADVASAYDNATGFLGFLKNSWEKILTVIGGVLLIALGVFILMRHQAAQAASSVAPAAALM